MYSYVGAFIQMKLDDSEPASPRSMGLPSLCIATRLDFQPSFAMLDRVAWVLAPHEQVGVSVVVVVHDQAAARAGEPVSNGSAYESREPRGVEQLLQTFILAFVQKRVEVVEQIMDILNRPEEIARGKAVG